VTTPAFLELGGLPSLRDLPDLDPLEEAGLLRAPLPEELRGALGIRDEAEEEVADGNTEDEEFHLALPEEYRDALGV
jgi:hypothetical protein